jgi:hypothetical protein
MRNIFKTVGKACREIFIGPSPIPVKPTWDALKVILQERQPRLVEELPSIKVRFNRFTVSRFENIEQLDTFLVDQLTALKNKDYNAIKTQTVFRDTEQVTVVLDDFLLNNERHYINGPRLDNHLRLLIERIAEVITLRDTDFNCSIMINQHFENILLEYWELYVNSLK